MLKGQERVKAFYNSDIIQITVACLIGANFLTNMVEKEVDPTGLAHEDIFYVFEWFYNVCFTIELIVNIYAHWWCEFWCSAWNCFDVVVVAIGVLTLSPAPLPPALSLLRNMRAFRVFRLFKRVHSLNKIILAILHAIPGMRDAFLILGIVMSIYAILGVEFYARMAEGCLDPLPVWEDVPAPSLKLFATTRGECFGPEYFGTFSRSLYTMFQVLTGESWSELIARPAIWFYIVIDDSTPHALGGAFFFTSYILATSFMLINVVVAVLLDKMSDPDTKAEATEKTVTHGGEPWVGDTKREDEEGAVDKINPGDLNLTKVLLFQEKVGELVDERNRMKIDLEAFRGDVADVKQKLKTLLEIVCKAPEKEEV